MDSGGFIKVWRKMLDSEVMQDDWLCRLWMWCLLKAKWRPAKREGDPDVGQFITSKSRCAEELNVHPSKVYRGLQRLRSIGCIELDTDNERTTITVCNFQTYQNDEDSGVRAEARARDEPVKAKKSNQHRTTEGQGMNDTCDNSTVTIEPPENQQPNHERTASEQPSLLEKKERRKEPGDDASREQFRPGARGASEEAPNAWTGHSDASTDDPHENLGDNLLPMGLEVAFIGALRGRRLSVWEKPAERFELMIELGIPAYEIRREIRLPHGTGQKKRHRAEQLEVMCQRIEARFNVSAKPGVAKKKGGFAGGVRGAADWANEKGES